LVDITDEFLKLRYYKSPWEIDRIREAFGMSWLSYQTMAAKVAPGAKEYEVAAAGEYVARQAGASSFAFKTIVGSGLRSNAVVPTAMDKVMQAGETVMLGIAPRSKGYSGVFGHSLPVSGKYTALQAEYLHHMKEVLALTRDMLKPGAVGREIDAPGRAYYKKYDLMKYLVCPFAHTIGLMEAEAPFFGPNSNDALRPGMAVCVDVSFFGHPQMNGIRIETGYEITEKGAVPFSPEMEKELFKL
jgi:Xaa-Pro aminopeptidase